MRNWLRYLAITFSGKDFKTMRFETKYDSSSVNCLNLSANGVKQLSPLKDVCTIKIRNLTYNEITALIKHKLYDVKIECGYYNGNRFTIFEGGVLYVSNDMDSDRTNTAIILCANKLVAKYGQSRLNLTLRSGINMYAAVSYLCRRAGISQTNISDVFKGMQLHDDMSNNATIADWLQSFTDMNQQFVASTDASNATVTVSSLLRPTGRIIQLRNEDINFSGGYPTLSSDGLDLSLLPFREIRCGDYVQIPAALINMPVTTSSEISQALAYRLDPQDQYLVYKNTFSLQNRGSNFSMHLLCKSRSFILNLIGVR